MAARHPALLGWSLGGAVAHLAAQSPGVPLSSLVLFGFIMDPELTYADQPAPEKPAQALAADPVRVDWTRESEFNALSPARLFITRPGAVRR